VLRSTSPRVDYNVPLDENGLVANNNRIVASLPTIKKLISGGAAKIIVASHLGRPDGKVVPKLTLKPVAQELERLLQKPVTFLNDCVGEEVTAAACSPSVGGAIIMMLENLRFHLEEEGKCKLKDGSVARAQEDDILAFRASLSGLADIYVNDAFGTVHRAHSSISGISIEPRVAGLLVQKELLFFAKVLEGPAKIHTLLLGGAKVSDKIALIENMLPRVENVLIGGGMAFTFLKQMNGFPIGNSLFDEAGAGLISGILKKAAESGVKIHLPVDFIQGDTFKAEAQFKIVSDAIDESWLGLDIGPKTQAVFAQVIKSAPKDRVILWNGPMGVFEWEAFAEGTRAVLGALVEATESGCITIVGGGESAAAVSKWNCQDKLSHVSTGGGASLELLEGKGVVERKRLTV
jgi:phosphoglycerate kinase